MSKNINAAYRIINVLEELRRNQTGTATYQVLGSVFGISGNDIDTRRDVSKRLPLLADQIEHILNDMVGTQYNEDLYKGYLQTAIHWSISFNLDAGWNSYVNHISNELILALKWCSEVLPDEEEHFDASTIGTWLERVDKLLIDISSSDLSIGLKQLLSKHLQSLRDALNSYQLVGLKTIEDSLLQTVAGLRRQSNQLNAELQEASVEVKNKISEYEELLKEVSNVVDSADKTRSNDMPPLLTNFKLYGTYVPART